MAKSPLPGVNVLLMGASGTGKTHAIQTLISSGITPFCIFTEPGFETISHIPPDKLHWHYVKPADQSSVVKKSKVVTEQPNGTTKTNTETKTTTW